ncbi:MAG: hypothetical protein L3K09_06610 [Thermoplasmata archaeon]|nr:hypothetical protein [Thermoplasmata archaeon]
MERRLPVAFGAWKDETPNRRSRLRAVQRWRLGSRGRDQTRGARHLFPYVWPVGERQRKELEPGFPVSPVISSGTWRVFLYNCSPEVIRDVRVTLDGTDLDYAPSLLEGRFAEIHWQKVEAIKAACLSDTGGRLSGHQLSVDFVIARGTRQARVLGELTLDAQQGWLQFDGRDGRRRELE